MVTLQESVGRYGIWTSGLRPEGPAAGEAPEAAAELEELGFGAVWLGMSDVEQAVPLIEATSRLTVATGILSIWQHEAADTAARFLRLESEHPGRFVLGIGASHAKFAAQYQRPYSSLAGYLDGLDEGKVPAGRIVLAALGPKMLELSRDRAGGAHPYLVTPEHTAQAREILGSGPLLAPELKVVLDTDPETARATARDYLAMYLTLPNYTNSFLRLGFTEDDIANGGSDRLIDAVYAWGDDARIKARIDAFHAAGADHVALQIVTPDSTAGAPGPLPRAEWRRLAEVIA
ncbi:LLM class F420-dependent oxidoreductase [Streptomyces sp. NPDC056909]|uniref:LLM class F420-dependent oxidoreductase n=1 Tax=unclassified Streptomyces TaxID=2593676 RepID=UPI0036D0D79A